MKLLPVSVWNKTLVLMPMVAWSLKWRGYRQTAAWLNGMKPRGGVVDHARIVAIVSKVAGWGRFNCLQRALTLQTLLRQQGYPAELRIGVRKNGDQMTAHAWVELDGEVLNDRADIATVYAPFPAFDGSIRMDG